MSESEVPDSNSDNVLAVQTSNIYHPAACNGPASVLANANNVRIKDSAFCITTNVNVARNTTLEALYERVAPNAILNEGGRADDAKCHPGTREEIIGLIEDWADAAYGDRVLWLTGPAGGGKTAIMKTIAERARNRGARCTVNFFFFRGDSTRNSAHSIVPTLLYQLFQIHPDFQDTIAEILRTHPRILDMSIAEQCRLISTLSSVIRQSVPAYARTILLVDGLDECDIDAEQAQGNILRALEGLVMEHGSPFRLLVASRPEARIQMTFNQISHAQTIFLNDQYSPENDIRKFVTAEFLSIKSSHPRASLLSGDWPSLSDIQRIVVRSSGQFIYAATVMRYISHPSIVPSLSLERVQGISPAGKNSPFAHLDSVYSFILARVDNQSMMRDILSMQLLQIGVPGSMDLLRYYDSNYNEALLQSCTSELSAIVQLTKNGNLRFYHASFADFLIDRTRSGTYWIDADAFGAKVLAAIWTDPPIETDAPYINLQVQLFRKLISPSPAITKLLLEMPVPDWILYSECRMILLTVQKLYYRNDVDVYKRILRRLIHAFCPRDTQPPVNGIPFAADYILSDGKKPLNQHWWTGCLRRHK